MGERRFSTKNRFVSFLLAIAMVLTLLPIGAVQAKAEGSRQIIMHFKNSTNWEAVYTKIAEGDSWTAVDGYGYANSWPGAEVEKDSANEGWYSFTISTNSEKEFHCIFNNKDHGKQTANINFKVENSKIEKWVTGEGDQETVIMDQAPEGWKESASNAPVKPVINVQSPVVNEDRTVTFNLDATGEYKDAEDVCLMGTVEGTDWTNGLPMNKVGDKFTVTVPKQNPGIYGYKYKIGTSWITDPANDAMTDGNSRLVVPGLESKNMEALAGKDLELPKTLKLYGDDGTSSDETVSYTLKDPSLSDKVTLKDETINVKKGSGIKTVDLIATAGNEKSDVTVNVVQKQYKVTINMYSPDFEMKSGVSDVYIYNKNGAEKEFVPLNNTIEDTENNVTWLQGTTYVSFNSLGIIGRPTAGSWDGQDSNQYYVINEEKSEITLWYVFGKKPVIEKPVITKADPRYLCLEYENDTLTTTPEFYSWTTGIEEKVRKPFESDGNGKWKIKVPVKSTCTKVDFVVVLDPSGSDWIKDGGDHSIAFPQEQNVVCASMKKGEEPVLSAPYNKGYEVLPKENKIAFYFRDDNALIEDKLSDMNVSVDIDGKEYPMTYNAENKRFEYNYNELKSGRTLYRYKVGEKYILDKYNDKKEKKDGNDYSYIEYYKLNASIQAEVMNASFNYNENNVVKFTVNQDENEKKLEVASASIDVSSLGGSSALAIVPDLQAVTISATTDTTLGKKTLPIVVTDQYGNEYTTSVQVEVAARNKKNADDFDWDESVIYFMVTDRFFDGNESNNTASGAKTYGKDNAGLYHGGDFAGITQKLDYLEDLGINTIWITPIVENIPGVTVTDTGKEDVPYNAAYHGYWASDFTKLNPTLGTEEEFQTLIDQAHNRGIRIMVDIVVNHAGYDTDFGDMIRSGDDIVSGSDQKDSLSNLPDFRTEDPAVSAQLVKWQTQWVKDFGIDYFRVDTVKHVENDTWAELKNALTEVDSDFKMIGEYAGGGYASNGNTLGTGEMDSDLDFDFNDQATNFVKGNISSVESFLTSRNSGLNNTYMTGQFLGSHDEDGFKKKLLDGGMAEDAATAASMVAASLQITAKGQPVIYYGEEIGLTGLNNYPYQTNRYDFDWTMVNSDNKTYQHYKKMLSIRNAYTDVFARGDRKTILASDENGYDIVSRSYKGTKLYVGLNIKDVAQTVEIPVSENNGTVLKDLYSGKTYTVSNGKIKVIIPAATDGGTVVLKNNSSTNGGSTGGSSSSGSTTTQTKPSEDTKKDATTTESVIPAEKLPEGTTATVTVTKDASGKVTAEAAVAATGKTSKTGVKATVNADVIQAVTEAAGTKDVTITQEVKKADGTTA